MVELTYKKGVYMQVSAISSANNHTVFNTRVNSRGGDNYMETALSYLNLKSDTKSQQSELFESINEWKNFCHKQIENGKLDIIA